MVRIKGFAFPGLLQRLRYDYSPPVLTRYFERGSSQSWWRYTTHWQFPDLNSLRQWVVIYWVRVCLILPLLYASYFCFPLKMHLLNQLDNHSKWNWVLVMIWWISPYWFLLWSFQHSHLRWYIFLWILHPEFLSRNLIYNSLFVTINLWINKSLNRWW